MEEFCYVRHYGNCDVEIKTRLKKFSQLANIWKSSRFNVWTKHRLYEALVFSTFIPSRIVAPVYSQPKVTRGHSSQMTEKDYGKA